MPPSWYGTLCLGTGAAARYRMHLCILAGMVHCVLVQVLRCDIGCWYGTLCLSTSATVRYRIHLCIWYGTLCLGTGAAVRYRMLVWYTVSWYKCYGAI